MSSFMMLSIKEKQNILDQLIFKRSKKFNKEYVKLMNIIKENHLHKSYEEKLHNLKEEFKKELKTITINDVDWERHERKGADIEKKFNRKLLDIKYEINSLLNALNDLKKLYSQYEEIYKKLVKKIKNNDKYKNLMSEIKKLEFKQVKSLSEVNTMKNNIQEELHKLEDINQRLKIISTYDLGKFKEKLFTVNNELDSVLEKLRNLNEKEYKRIKDLNTDEELKLKEAKVIYQKLMYTQIFKEEIDTILNDLPPYLQKKFSALKEKEIIEKKEYEKLLDEYYNQKSNEVSFDKIVNTFEKLGYRFEEVVLNKKGYINTDKEEYKLAYRIENGKLNLAFTRIIDENTKINEYEKEKDKQMAKKWCSDFEKISELLKSQGIDLKKEFVKEPDEIDIRYEIKKKSNKQTNENKINLKQNKWK